ncbi:MAG: iron exporter MbfA [Tepidisphaeraceae bacterium]
MRAIEELSDKEVLALAIGLEERDGRLYGDFADDLRDKYPDSARVLERMRDDESSHRDRLTQLFRERFGDTMPAIRPDEVKGMNGHKPGVLNRPWSAEAIRERAAEMERTTHRFYEAAASKTTDAAVRQLLNSLADEERAHAASADHMKQEFLANQHHIDEAETKRRTFVLQIVQPGLAGLMDGSVSTLAPLFAAAFATHDSWKAFQVGLAASLGAGISMGFAEAMSDDGQLSGRGNPLLRGAVCGAMTTVGGIGHTLPYLVPQFHTATTIAIIIVLFELVAISWIRKRYMDTPFLRASIQVIVGGLLVFLAGILIGNS